MRSGVARYVAMRLDVTDAAGGIRGLSGRGVGVHEGCADARAYCQRATAASHLSAVVIKRTESEPNIGNSTLSSPDMHSNRDNWSGRV